MSALTRVSLKNRALIALISIAIVVIGLFSMGSLRRELIPDIDLPAAFVVTAYPGASADVVQNDLTEPIEKAANGVPGVTTVSSTSRDSVSTVVIELEYGTDINDATRLLNRNLDQISSTLPSDADPQVVSGSLSDMPVIQISVTSELGTKDLMQRLDTQVVPELQKISGVRSVVLMGGQSDRVVIATDQAKLAAAGLSVPKLTDALSSNGVVVPAGTVHDDTRTLSVEVGSRFASLDEVKKIPVGSANGKIVKLSDVATVEEKPKESQSVARTDSKESLTLAITKKPDGNTVDVSQNVRDQLDTLTKQLGHGTNFTVSFDQAPFITNSIEGLTTEGLLGLGFAIIVILLFLLAISPTIVSAISIPLSLLMAMIGLNVAGYSLNILTLGALTVAIGRVVDDSIVVIENIKRHLSYGGAKGKSILEAVKEVVTAITASTVTTMAVFVPIGFVSGQVGELFRPFAFTVAIAMAASWIVAITIVPVLAYWFIRPPVEAREAQAQGVALSDKRIEQIKTEAEDKERRSFLQRLYLPSLRAALAHPVIVIVIAILVFVGTFGLAGRLQTNFLGDMGDNSMTISMKLPAGTSLATTDEAAKKIEGVLDGTDGIDTYSVSIGSSGNPAADIFSGGGSGGNTASFTITTDENANQTELQTTVRNKVNGLDGVGDVTVSTSMMGMGASNVQVNVTANDADTLAVATEQVVNAVKKVDGMTDVTSNLAEKVPTLQVTVDRNKAAAAGMTESSIGQTVYAAINGIPAKDITVDSTVLPTVITIGDAPTTPAQVKALPVGVGPTGPITVGQVAAVEEVEVPTTLTRLNGEQAVTVSATPASDDLSSASSALQEALDGIDLPDGAQASLGGVISSQSDAFKQLGLALLLAITIVYLVMVATFKSLIQPLILMVSIPFAATGAIAGLLVTGTPLGVPALIGLLMLVGIVVTNAIVLIDLINQYREKGNSPYDAVIEGGRHRLRPILMTAFATIFALIPMAIGITGGGVFISKPLAIVVIGGLLTSTLLTLILVPVLYLLVERVRGKSDERQKARSLERAAKRREKEAQKAKEAPQTT